MKGLPTSHWKRQTQTGYPVDTYLVKHFRLSPLALQVSESVRVQMNRQSWALEPGQVAAALFSDEIDDDVKSRMASRILTLMPVNFQFPSVAGTLSSLPSQPTSSQPTLPTKDDLTRGKPPLPEITTG